MPLPSEPMTLRRTTLGGRLLVAISTRHAAPRLFAYASADGDLSVDERTLSQGPWLAEADATILALTSEINALQAQKAADRVEFMFAAKGLLTPEQFTKFTELRGKRGGPGMRGGKGGFGERGFHKRGGKRGHRDGKHGRFGKRGGQFQGPQAPEVDAE